jgi:hypothetical protein
MTSSEIIGGKRSLIHIPLSRTKLRSGAQDTALMTACFSKCGVHPMDDLQATV